MNSDKIESLKKRLVNGEVIIMDGGTGTEILRRGVTTPLPLWSAGALMTNPEVVQQIHQDYIRAGAEIIITDSFRTTARTLTKKGIGYRARELTLLSCNLAKNAIEVMKPKGEVYIAGSIAPLEDCYIAYLTPDEKDLKREHLERARDLKDGGVDFLLVETMMTIKEAYFALEATQKVGMPCAISFTCTNKYQLRSGQSLRKAIKAISQFNPLFISINCTSTLSTTKIMKKMKEWTKIPFGAYANGQGLADNKEGWKFIGNNTPYAYKNEAQKWVKYGAQIIGGCCGTDPEYIRLLKLNLPRTVS